MGLEELISERGDLPSLSGSVGEVVYRNAANDYSVIMLESEEGEEICAVGVLPGIKKGEQLRLYGDWEFHPTYGQQFSITGFDRVLPTEVNDIVRYLGSGVIRGVGPVTALKIVNRFGADTFDVIENHPTWLADIPGITRKKAAEITKLFCQQNGLHKLMMCCRDYLSTLAITRVYKTWGDRALSIIEEDPYRLCDEIDGVGFDKADTIAKKLGIVADSEHRILSACRYILQYNTTANGHVCLPKDKLISACSAQLSLTEEKVGEVVKDALDRKLLFCFAPGEHDYIFTPEVERAESYVAHKLLELSRGCASVSDRDIGSLIHMTEAESSIHYARLQVEAIHRALSTGVMILTGGPGTGKTTVVKALLRIFSQMGLKTALCAPTGRAAKRMAEATGEAGRTIHRMLEMEKSEEGSLLFRRNEMNPLDFHVVIVDEASMIDLPLMEGLLRATIRGTRLILIGDDNQLPPVGGGNVLRDMIDSNAFDTVCLKEIFRQAEESKIIVNAHRINLGEMPLLQTEKGDDSFFMARSSDEQIVDTILSLVTQRLPKAYGQDIVDKLQVITPSRKGMAGTEHLNRQLKDLLNPPSDSKEETKFRDLSFREGDKVMQIRNNYDIEWTKGSQKGTGVFNGDIGTILRIDKQNEIVQIVYDDRVCDYDFQMLEEIEHAYAITVHKSQGSEYPVVIIPLYHCAPVLRTRNLFYTATTRAKQMLIMVGSEQVARNMVENNRQTMRYTALSHRLCAQ